MDDDIDFLDHMLFAFPGRPAPEDFEPSTIPDGLPEAINGLTNGNRDNLVCTPVFINGEAGIAIGTIEQVPGSDCGGFSPLFIQMRSSLNDCITGITNEDGTLNNPKDGPPDKKPRLRAKKPHLRVVH